MHPPPCTARVRTARPRTGGSGPGTRGSEWATGPDGDGSGTSGGAVGLRAWRGTVPRAGGSADPLVPPPSSWMRRTDPRGRAGRDHGHPRQRPPQQRPSPRVRCAARQRSRHAMTRQGLPRLRAPPGRRVSRPPGCAPSRAWLHRKGEPTEPVPPGAVPIPLQATRARPRWTGMTPITDTPPPSAADRSGSVPSASPALRRAPCGTRISQTRAAAGALLRLDRALDPADRLMANGRQRGNRDTRSEPQYPGTRAIHPDPSAGVRPQSIRRAVCHLRPTGAHSSGRAAILLQPRRRINGRDRPTTGNKSSPCPAGAVHTRFELRGERWPATAGRRSSTLSLVAPLMGWTAPAPGIAMCHIGCCHRPIEGAIHGTAYHHRDRSGQDRLSRFTASTRPARRS